ncbi:MAG: Outer membrane receptor proteins, mostly Fe transport [uncultured Caballeronia sp.]|nr:MAG: Outer membrane receptor proteins, mostly Fe transport [uncultured Caballeronia sp.]
MLRASIGRAYRFPTVGELFQGQITDLLIVNNKQPEPEAGRRSLERTHSRVATR